MARIYLKKIILKTCLDCEFHEVYYRKGNGKALVMCEYDDFLSKIWVAYTGDHETIDAAIKKEVNNIPKFCQFDFPPKAEKEAKG